MAEHFKKEPARFEFTKIVIAGVMILYYLTALYAFIYIAYLARMGEFAYSVDCFKALLVFIQIPIPIAIGFYCWKARGENIPKQYQRMLNDIEYPQLKAIFL